MAESSPQTLVLALTHHVLLDIAHADSVLDEREQAVLDELAPRSELVAHGLVNEAGERSEAFDGILTEALTRLPLELDLDAKLELVGRFLRMAIADDDLDHAEGSVLIRTAALLAISSSQLDAWLADHDDVAELDELPEPETEEG